MLISRAFAIRNRASFVVDIPWLKLTGATSINTYNFQTSSVYTAPNPLNEKEYLARDVNKFGMRDIGANVKLNTGTLNINRILTDNSIIYEITGQISANNVIDAYVFICIGGAASGTASQVVIEISREELVAGGLVLDSENKNASRFFLNLKHTMERPY